MDERSKERLQIILSKEPAILTKDDIGFLKARRSYLTEEQTQKYQNVLNPKVINQTSDTEPVKQNAKKSK